MKTETAYLRIKNATHDISDEFTYEQYIDFLNNAIQQVASLLIAGMYPPLIKEAKIFDGDELPKNYMRSAGTYPIKITANTVQLIDDEDEFIKLRYFATPEMMDGSEEELPFNNDAINEVVIKTAILLALNENEYDIQQDSALLQALQQAVASGMGA